MSDKTSLAKLLEELPPQEISDQIARKGLLGKKEFLLVLDRDIDLSVRELESQAQFYKDDKEEKLTGFIVAQLKCRGYDATSETNERGHVDLRVQQFSKLNLLWLGEAKIHSSYCKNADGLRQLIERYSSGRDKDAGMLLYVKGANASAILKRWGQHLMEEDVCSPIRISEQGDFSFLSQHRHSSGVVITVKHRAVNLYFCPIDASARKSKKRASSKQ